jgi:hypothetical protein
LAKRPNRALDESRVVAATTGPYGEWFVEPFGVIAGVCSASS